MVWEEALPLGNGFLGAMFYGGIDSEKILLNQESVWYGGFRDRINPDAKDNLEHIRKLIFNGELASAEEASYNNLFGTPMSQGHYEPLGELNIVFNEKIPHHSEMGTDRIQSTAYQRSLDLSKAIYNCTYTTANDTYTRESFASYPDGIIAIRLTQTQKLLNFRLELSRSDMSELNFAEKDTLVLSGNTGGRGTHFVAMAKVILDGGEVIRQGAHLKIKNAQSATILITGTTDYYNHDPFIWCKGTLKAAEKHTYEMLKQRHLEDYQKLYNQVSLNLFSDKYDHLPTNQRLEAFAKGQEDQGLLTLYFNYGRYLLIACSRKGTLPANLQGIWNKEYQPPWGCKYTININTQMNYWLAEVTGLSECHLPLLDHLLKMAPHGRKVAQKMYGCRGIVAHHNTDIYGDCAPQDQWMPATIWPMGMAWLATHIIEHYRFTQNKQIARAFFPLLEEALLFLLDFLVKDPKGRWVTNPSVSPENTYVLENGEKSALCFGPTMDTQIIRELGEGFIELLSALDMDSTIRGALLDVLAKLPDIAIGNRGQILEWSEEYLEWEKGHRHISHLYGLHPGSTITRAKTPELFEAARVTLEERLCSGGGHTGWSRAWIINFYARLYAGEEALDNIKALLSHATAPNLFDMHPPFQIDGNFGAAAGMAEMLLQSHDGYIHLLPALPSAWANGEVIGLRARGGLTVHIKWSEGILNQAMIKADKACKVILRYENSTEQINLKDDEVYVYNSK